MVKYNCLCYSTFMLLYNESQSLFIDTYVTGLPVKCIPNISFCFASESDNLRVLSP